MTDRPHGGDRPVLDRRPAPDHGPAFWHDLEAAIGQAGPTRPDLADVSVEPRPTGRRFAGLRPGLLTLAAAALVAALGIGAIVARSWSDTARSGTDLAAVDRGSDGAAIAPDAGAATDGGGATDTAAPVQGVEPGGSQQAVPAADAPAGASSPGVGADAPGDSLALARELATWSARQIRWYAVADPGEDCRDGRSSEIVYTDAVGTISDVHDPQLYFGGAIDHFVIEPARGLAAWLVSCADHLELHVASLGAAGEIRRPVLAWFGDGQPASALLLWDASTVSLNALSGSGEPFFVDYEWTTGELGGNAPIHDAGELGLPGGPAPVLVAAGPGADRSFWVAGEPAAVERCAVGSSGGLWLRSVDTATVTWTEVVVDGYPLASVTAVALDEPAMRIAIADGCAARDGTVIVGTLLPDGRVIDASTVELSPYVGGIADELHWVDGDTLRIETDNSAIGAARHRFDLLVDEGAIVQLD